MRVGFRKPTPNMLLEIHRGFANVVKGAGQESFGPEAIFKLQALSNPLAQA
jgi:hypothetical protein